MAVILKYSFSLYYVLSRPKGGKARKIKTASRFWEGGSRRLSPAQGIGGARSGRGAKRRGRSDSGAPQSPVFCGKEAPLYGALKSKKCAKKDRKK
jgi:hypothetical protein